MAIKYSDWIGESVSSSGTGNITLGGRIQGFAPMSSAGNGEVYYTIVDGFNKETGLGTYGGSGSTFIRTTVIATLIDGVYTPNGAPLNLSGNAQIYGTVNSGTMNDIFTKLAQGDADITELYAYIDQQIAIVNSTIDNLGPDDVGAYPRTGGDLTGKANFKNSTTGIHIEGGSVVTGSAGDFRYNPTLGLFEGYFNGKWRNVGGGTGVVWSATAVSVNPAEVGKGYLINAANLVITLPSAPEAGNSIGIGDYQGKNFTATVVRNGKPIMGLAEDFTFNVKNASVVFSFVDNTIGWVLTQGFGESSASTAIISKSRFTNVAGQTVFNFPNYGIDSTDVYYNGLKLDRNTDYSANNTANTVTLAKAVDLADDIIEMYNWNNSESSTAAKVAYDNSVSKVPATTMQGAIDYLSVLPNKNLLINGGMRISQRGASGSIPTGQYVYTLDRWVLDTTGAAVSWSHQGGPTGSPSNSLSISGAAGNTSIRIRQCIEAANSFGLSGKKVTVSFKLWGNAGGTITPRISIPNTRDDFNNTTLIQSGTDIPLPSVEGGWSQKYSFTFNALPASVINGLMLAFTTSPIVASKNFAISEIKLEIGEVATVFEYPEIAEELAACQRYYQQDVHYPTYINGTTFDGYTIVLPVKMRAAPIVTILNRDNAGNPVGVDTYVANNFVRFSGVVSGAGWSYSCNAEL